MANDKVKIATSKLTALADAIRNKGGTTEPLLLADIPTIVPSLAAYNPPTWADGSWNDIIQALAKHEAGTIDLYTTPGWEIGATRTVPLAAMGTTAPTGVGVGESHVAQDVEMVLMDKNVVDLAAGGKCNFVIGMKNCLAKSGYMNSGNTNSGGWRDCQRRTWCNNVFANAVPDELKSLVKNASIKTSAGNESTTIKITTDTWFLPCEYNVFGQINHSVPGEDTVQWEWYKTAANRIKRFGTGGGGAIWWERSPRSINNLNFCYVSSSGGFATGGKASDTLGLAPHACI